MKSFNVSATLIKAWMKVKFHDACMKQFFEVYIDKSVPFVETPAMRQGKYFEYLVTGKGDTTEPETTKKGEPTADYERIIRNAENCKKALQFHGWNITDADVKMEVTTPSGVPLKGIFDIISIGDDADLIIDLKNSGLLDNKWEATGWHKDTFGRGTEGMPHLNAIQGLQYALMYYLAKGIIPDVAFVIYNPKAASLDAAIFYCSYTESRLNEYLTMCEKWYEEIRSSYMSDWKFSPCLANCSSCPVENCKKRQVFPDRYNFKF